MDWKAIKRRQVNPRGWRRKDPIHQNRDRLEDLKLKQELMKMMREDHMKHARQYLSREDQERLAYEWMQGSDDLMEGDG